MGKALKYIILAAMPSMKPKRPIANNVSIAFSLLPTDHRHGPIHLGKLSLLASVDFGAISSGNFSFIFSSAISAASSSIF